MPVGLHFPRGVEPKHTAIAKPRDGCRSFQEAVDNLRLRFRRCQAQGHQLRDLLASNLSDGGFMDQLRVQMVAVISGMALIFALSMMMPSHSECPLQRLLPLILE